MKSTRNLAVAAILVIGGAVTAFTCIEKSAAYASQVTPARLANDWANPFRISSPAYREAEKYHQWMLNNRKLQVATSSLSGIDRLRLAGQMEANGVARLPDEALERYLPLSARVLNSMDDKTCAALLNGKVRMQELTSTAYPVIESFNDADAKTWFDISRSALSAKLDNLPVVVLPKEKGKQGLLAVAASLPADQIKPFLQRLLTLTKASDAEQCAAIRTIFSRGSSLPEPYRGYVARFLLAGKEGRGRSE